MPLIKYWQKHPPAHVILGAVYMKRESEQPATGLPQKPAPPKPNLDNLGPMELLQSLPGVVEKRK